MSFYQARQLLPQRFRLVLLSELQARGLSFADVLSEEEIENVFDEEGVSFGQEDDQISTDF
jgi:hypothetical protein